MEQKERSFEMAKRLKDLRNSKKLSHEKLKDELQHRYGIKISRASLLNYEIDNEYTSKSDAFSNLKMNAEYLNCLADFYGVSTDYLLCRTDIKVADVEVRAICDYTGLSSETIASLHTFYSGENVPSNFLSRLIEDLACTSITEVEDIASNIIRAAHAAAIYDKSPGRKQNAAVQLRNIIDSMNGDDNGMFRISALDAATYYLERAKGDATKNIASIIEAMTDELVERDTSDLVCGERGTVLWPLSDEDSI